MTDDRGFVITGASLAGAKAAETLREEGFDGRITLIGEEGDVASAWHPLFARRIRLEHWSSALNQGPAAARNMLGRRTPYERVPYFYSDQYDVGMEYSGYAPGWDQVVFRGDPAGREFIAFWLKDGRVVAGMNVNVWDVADSLAAMVAAVGQVDLSRLLDPDVELAALAG
jgi:3-phenylpropionate/trans-cinnamate dioxygenase ferredoxin reductase component